MKFIYFYSQLYDYYNSHIRNNLSEHFELENIKIDDLNNTSGHTFFGGVSIKIELVIQKIKENMGSTIVFSDATIFVNKRKCQELPSFFESYINNDLVFIDEKQEQSTFCIGLILIKCNNLTLDFFNTVLADLTFNKGWDQEVINRLLKTQNSLVVNTFDREKICSGYEFPESTRNTFLIFKSFIEHKENKYDNFNARIHKFFKSGLINAEEYRKSIVKDPQTKHRQHELLRQHIQASNNVNKFSRFRKMTL